jgi:hypothetical protein
MPEYKNLLNILTGAQSAADTAIGIASASIPETQTEIDLMTEYCVDVDEKILPIIKEIKNLQSQIITLHNEAFAVGCGTTTDATSLNVDIVTNNTQNVNDKNYTGTNPFGGESTTEMDSFNVGVGVLTVYDANGGPGIGTLYAGISSCYDHGGVGGCTVDGDCAGYATSIANLNNQITTLRNQLPSLISDTNVLKEERRQLEIQRYGDLFIIGRLGERKTNIDTAKTTIQGS